MAVAGDRRQATGDRRQATGAGGGNIDAARGVLARTGSKGEDHGPSCLTPWGPLQNEGGRVDRSSRPRVAICSCGETKSV